MKNNKLLTALLQRLNHSKDLMEIFKNMYIEAKKEGNDAKKIADTYRFYSSHLNTYFDLIRIVEIAYGVKTAEKLLNI
jgi:hypothetical protein